MKRLNFLLAGLIAFGAVSCSDDDSNSTSTGNSNAIRNNMKSGTWSITSYTDDGENETHHFAAYDFTFGENGVLTATNGTNTYTGIWSVTSDDSGDDDDDNGSDDIDFNIGFTSPEVFADELTDDWDVESRTGNRITLVDISGGNGGTDRIVFEKN